MGVQADGGSDGGIALAVTFAGAARRYWLGVFPNVCLERRRRRARARAIPDPRLRAIALRSQRKWGNVEGAAAFATLAPRRRRAAAARAMMCFQAAYNYLDMLGEQPCEDPAANGRQLHLALLAALDPDMPHPDYYAHNHRREDGGYLRELLDDARVALSTLPSYTTLAPTALAAAQRIVEFQSCNTGERQGDLAALERWARGAISPDAGLRWWEVAAASGSSLCVYALIALAAEPDFDPDVVLAVERAYWPWVGALHSLLDNLVDVNEDRVTGQHSLIGGYASMGEAAERMGALAAHALRATASLPRGEQHALILAAMASFYLSTPEACTPQALPVARAVLGMLDGEADLAMRVFRTRLRARRLLPGGRERRLAGAELVMDMQSLPPRGEGGEDARAA